MIRIEEVRTFSANADAVFHFLADFRNLPLWDPGITKSRLVRGDAHSKGAHFAIESQFLGLRIPLSYTTRHYDDSAFEAVIEGEGNSLSAVDRIFITARPSGCQLLWQADFELKCFRRLAEPMSRPLFRRLGEKAMSGLMRYAAKNPAFAPPFH
ncbi:MAG: ribosome-associated toxin RatA of RatAB toxin-antitoxin module [Polyangiales bacterium]|jgi:ribosome-associated toxin RatA of RatAB toxin-antitoxin module